MGSFEGENILGKMFKEQDFCSGKVLCSVVERSGESLIFVVVW